MGVHQWNVPLQDTVSFGKVGRTILIVHIPIVQHADRDLAQLFYMEGFLYAPAMLMTKLVILLQYISVFIPNHRSWDYYMTQCIILINVLYFTSVFLYSIFTCTPRAKLWFPSLPGHCINIPYSYITTALINLVLDFIMIVLPIRWIWRLQLPSKTKLGVSAIFATGLL